MGNEQSIECIQIVIGLYNECIETYLKLQMLLEKYLERDILLEAYSKQPNLDPSDKIFYEKHVEITVKNANLEKQFYEDYNKLKKIILDMQTEIIELETECELTPSDTTVKVKDIGEISTDKIGIHEKHKKIVDSINKLRQIVGNYKQQIIALKSKFKNKKPIRKSVKKSKSVKEHKSKTIKNKKVKSKNKSKKKSKAKRGL